MANVKFFWGYGEYEIFLGIWRMTKPLTSSSEADALAECYKNAGHWGSRIEILSITNGPLQKLFF